MQIQPRMVAVAAIGLGLLLLAAGCGSESTGPRTTLASIQATSFVTIEPATTTTTLLVTTSVDNGTSSEAQTYTVVAGDSVFKIASLFDVDPEVMANYNSWPEGVQHPIFVGDVVQIPPGAALPGGGGSTGPSAAPTTVATGPACTHTIAAGENPTRVARKYDVTYDELQIANPGMDFTTTFVVGDVLTIPANGSC